MKLMGNVMHPRIFSLSKFSDNFLEVSESMEVNGKRTFGYDEPIIYKRV